MDYPPTVNKTITLKCPDTRSWRQRLIRRKPLYLQPGLIYRDENGVVLSNLHPHAASNYIVGIALEDSYRNADGEIVGTVLIQGGFSGRGGE